jgi:hypothetical protein
MLVSEGSLRVDSGTSLGAAEGVGEGEANELDESTTGSGKAQLLSSFGLGRRGLPGQRWDSLPRSSAFLHVES